MCRTELLCKRLSGCLFSLPSLICLSFQTPICDAEGGSLQVTATVRRPFCQVAFVRLPVGGTRGILKVGNTANVLPDSATSITSALGPDSSSQLLAPGEPAPSCPFTNMTSNRAVTSPQRSKHQFFRASLLNSQVWRSVLGYGSCFLKSLPPQKK